MFGVREGQGQGLGPQEGSRGESGDLRVLLRLLLPEALKHKVAESAKPQALDLHHQWIFPTLSLFRSSEEERKSALPLEEECLP